MKKTPLAKNFNFYGQNDQTAPDATLRVVVATSIRNIGGDDKIGSTVKVGDQELYLKGTLESLLDATNVGAQYINKISVVGVVVDDMPQTDQLYGYSALPDPQNHNWIIPSNYQYRGQPIADLVQHIPSSFRALPLEDKSARRHAKEEFEKAVLQYADQVQADVILSDHLMLKIERMHTVMPTVNIHPAVTRPDSPYMCRGKIITAEIINRANQNGSTQTGATLHFINDNFDDGLIIADADHVQIMSGTSEELVRHQVYQEAKNPLVIEGLIHLANNMDYFCQATAANAVEEQQHVDNAANVLVNRL